MLRLLPAIAHSLLFSVKSARSELKTAGHEKLGRFSLNDSYVDVLNSDRALISADRAGAVQQVEENQFKSTAALLVFALTRAAACDEELWLMLPLTTTSFPSAS